MLRESSKKLLTFTQMASFRKMSTIRAKPITNSKFGTSKVQKEENMSQIGQLQEKTDIDEESEPEEETISVKKVSLRSFALP